jgi:cbb3-type cytochrome oxidase subunit 3
MGTLSTWEALLMGVMLILIIFWFRPGIKATLAESRKAEKDWRGFLFPIGFVVLFVLLLIMMV